MPGWPAFDDRAEELEDGLIPLVGEEQFALQPCVHMLQNGKKSKALVMLFQAYRALQSSSLRPTRHQALGGTPP